MSHPPAFEYQAIIATTHKYSRGYLLRIVTRFNPDKLAAVFFNEEIVGKVTGVNLNGPALIAYFLIDERVVIDKSLFPLAYFLQRKTTAFL